jgi:hypothetical protein
MMTELLATGDDPELHPDLTDGIEPHPDLLDDPDLSPGLLDDPDLAPLLPAACWPAGNETLLFGLSVAMALPPTAMMVSPDGALPTVRSGAPAILTSRELSAVLDRPTTEVGRGRIALGEVDQRMHRLAISLDVFRVTDGSGALVALGVVSLDPLAGPAAGATIADLWALAREAVPYHGVVQQLPDGFGDDALLVIYGGITAQVVWLAGDRLVTASMTSLRGGEDWMAVAVCALATVLDRRLR